MTRGMASYKNSLRLSREAKRRRTGTCSECGGVTRYNGRNGRAVSDLCHTCSSRRQGDYQRQFIGTGWRQRELFSLLEGGERRFTELRDSLGVSSGYMAVMLNRQMKHGLVVRVRRGVYRLP